MASTPSNLSDDTKKLDLDSVLQLITIIHHQMNQILENKEARKALKQKCFSKLKIQSQEFFEFSEHSILSNLYWGIESTEEAALAAQGWNRTNKLQQSENKLQIPASLDENGVTLGIPNSFLICCAYFYLSIVELLRKNEWQMSAHFLQAVLICPRVVYTHFAPGILENLLPLLVKLKGNHCDFFSEGFQIDEMMKFVARRYKPWLMYYQIMGNTICLQDYHKQKKLVSQDLSMKIPVLEKSSNIKCLKDLLLESEPDSPTYSDNASSVEEQDYVDDHHQAEARNQYGSLSWYLQAPFSKSMPERTSLSVRKTEHYTDEEEHIGAKNGLLLEQIISKLCFTDEDYNVEMKTIYEILNSKSGLKYSLLKDVILDQLLTAISTSKEEKVVRTSVAILSTIVTENRQVIHDIKRKGLQLYDLAMALKRNVHEAVILIYLINPSPAEIKALQLLPCLVELVCASNTISYKTSFFITPPAASLMIIEVLVTSFDYETNCMHLTAISSPRVLSGLVQVPRKNNIEELISLAAILVMCMRHDGKCRKHISEFSPVDSFVPLLWSNKKRATHVALDFFNELQRMPRSSAIGLLEQMHSTKSMSALFLLIQKCEPAEYRLLAANLLLQLQVLEDKSANCIYKEEAAKILIDSLTCEEKSTQALSAFILSNLGGTYSWMAEPYTVPWLLKKCGLTLANHRNLIKNYDFLDQSLQDPAIDNWCSKMGQQILSLGTSLFDALEKGLKSKSKRVSRDCLIATAWLGCELVKGPDELRNAACEIILNTIERYVHPGFDLEERLLACLCIYNYTSRRGMKKIVNLSEGVRESLRRLSNVTWMGEELLKVADYFQPNKWRISCVHSQVIEAAGSKSSGAVTALIYYRGFLMSGFADGSMKVWDIKGQTATPVQDIKEHRKAITSFALYQPRNCLLSGSSDKTIKIWQMLHKSLECIEVIPMKESIKSIESSGELIFATTQSHKLKVIDESRKAKDVLKNKRVKCIRVSHGKVYAGCMDSSIQELMIVNSRQQEMKVPSKSWMQNKAISSVAVYKDWLYGSSLIVEGSKIKDWRRMSSSQISIVPEKGGSILAMEVVEDFVYLNCTTSINSLQIWLRGTQQKVGRLSAGSKITSLLSANDMILCGTEKGVIKGWITL